jgi:hypothetical protein
MCIHYLKTLAPLKRKEKEKAFSEHLHLRNTAVSISSPLGNLLTLSRCQRMSYDLRKQYDPTGSQVIVVADRLHARHPTSANEMELPGLDCLIVALRSVYGRFVLGAQTNSRWMDASEEKNPILGYAWLSFDLEPKEN